MRAGVHSLIRFKVRPGQEAAFEKAFAETGMLSRPKAVAGFLGADLVRDEGAPGTYLVLGRWESADAYAEWQGMSAAGAPTEALRALGRTLIEPQPGRALPVVSSSEDL
jgi:heme-degrading monooxygenase HmoA